MNPNGHILIIRLSAMGDVAMSVPVLRCLRAAYPNLKITALTKAFFVPIIETIPGIDVVAAEVKTKHKGIPGLWKLAEELKQGQIDGIADFHDVLRTKILRLFLGVSGIHGAKIDKGRREKRALTRGKNKIFRPLKTSHQRYAAVLENMGLPFDWNNRTDLKPQCVPKSLKKVLPADKKWIGVAPFSAHPAKMYPLNLMKEVLGELDENPHYHILLFGGGRNENQQIEDLAENYSSATPIAGRFTFQNELATIAHLDLMLSMDSGNGHLAAMFEVPVITLWGPTHPYAGFAPFQQPEENQFLPNLEKYPQLPTSVFGKKQVPGHEDIMRNISPREVVEKIVDLTI